MDLSSSTIAFGALTQREVLAQAQHAKLPPELHSPASSVPLYDQIVAVKSPHTSGGGWVDLAGHH
jgi:hypothetical protein